MAGRQWASGWLWYPLWPPEYLPLVVRLSNPSIAASFVLGSPIDRNDFEAYISSVLVAELDQDDIVVMSNLSSSKRRQCAKGSKQRVLWRYRYAFTRAVIRM